MKGRENDMQTKIVSSLEKCFLTSDIQSFTALTKEAIFKNQEFSFQLLIYSEDIFGAYAKLEIVPEIESELASCITMREVVNIPCEMPVLPTADEGIVCGKPGLFPDLLRPLKYDGVMRIPHQQCRALYFTVKPEGKFVGDFDITIKLYKAKYDRGLKKSEFACEEKLALSIKDAMLPPQELMVTQWFHADCLADYYNVPVFSDRHFEICESFIKTAVAGGRNMLLLPLLTYSLDIHPGGYRTTVQLIDVYKNGDGYTFGYDNLDRWLDMCNRNGIKYYEVCHLFSQWGATATPKVMAYENGEYKRIFGWDTDPLSDEYKTFLRSFIKGFIDHMKERGEDKKCWFHISDEPITEHIPQFKAVKAIIGDLIEGYHHIDALSHYEFYEQGLVETPVPATCAIKPFIENNVPDLWCYYCGNHDRGVSNTQLSMSLARTRSIGIQMFKYNIKGFLQWGYNFYNNCLSYDMVDPYLDSCGEGFVPGGDTYAVYPAPDGTPYESIRFRAFYEAMEDMRAMNYAQSLYSHEEVVAAIEEIAGTVVFDKCILDSDTMLRIRRKIDEMIFDKL